MILVSGATGFVGRAITRHLIGGGFEVRAMSRSPDRARKVFERVDVTRRALTDGMLTLQAGDVTEPQTLPPAVEGVSAVIQAAQFPNAPNEDPGKGQTYANVDRNGTMNLLAAVGEVYGARTAGPGLTRFPADAPRFVYQSGVTVSESATESWDTAKWQAEEALRSSGLEWTVVRSSWTFGPDDTSLNRILGYSDYLPFVPIFGDGEELLTPIYIEDLGRLYLRLIQEPVRVANSTLPAGGPDVVSMNEFLRTALAVMGRRRPILHIPKPVGKIQGSLMQFLPGRPLTPMAVDFTSQGGVADPAPVLERFPDFGPTRIRAAFERYLAPAVRGKDEA